MTIKLSDYEKGPDFEGDFDEALRKLQKRLEKIQVAHIVHKRRSAERADELNDRIARSWPDIAQRIAAVSLAPDHLEKVLKAAGAEVTPKAIHLPRVFYDQALLRCREIRNRYTFLDLAANAGKLAPMLAKL